MVPGVATYRMAGSSSDNDSPPASNNDADKMDALGWREMAISNRPVRIIDVSFGWIDNDF